MKAYFITIILVISFTLSAFADSFQFYYKVGESSSYVSYQSVKLYDRNKRLVFSGFTDKFGRIAANVRAGTYTCKIMYQKKEYQMTLFVDNRPDYKKIYFGPSIRPYQIRSS